MKDVVLKHDADVAGGDKEIVYSYDGSDVPPLTFPIRATPLAELDESSRIPPEEAFQIFANKLYASNPYSSNQRSETTSQSNESPLVRLSRLQRELKELEMDCSTDEGALFQGPIENLREKLQSLSTLQAQKQQSLSSSIQKAMLGLTEPIPVEGPPSVPSVDGTSLEERLTRLEKYYSSNGLSATSGGGTNLLNRLDALEDQFSKLDEKKLDLLQKRSKVIRQDLEAAVKARHKLSSSNSMVSADDSKIIAALYDDFQRLQGLSQHLPALTQRLQALAHQHADSATRTARFKAMEQMTLDLSAQVQSIEVALTSLDSSIKQNATLIHENIQALEERLKAT